MNSVNVEYITQQPEENVAPQYVQIRSVNKSLVYLDSRSQVQGQNGIIEQDLSDMVFSTSKGQGQQSANLIKNCKRIKVGAILFDLMIPNVNPYNNHVQVTVNGVPYDVYIIEGFYNTPQDLINALIAALQAATGIAWIIDTAYNPVTKKFTLRNGPGLAFSFDNIGDTLNKVQYLYNIPRNAPNGTTLEIGPIFGYYTRYIDINSSTVTRYAKIRPSSNNNNNGNQIFRFFTRGFVTFVESVVTSSDSSNTFNWDRNDFAPQIDIQLNDEFGNKLYLQQNQNGPVPGYYNITLSLEV